MDFGFSKRRCPLYQRKTKNKTKKERKLYNSSLKNSRDLNLMFSIVSIASISVVLKICLRDLVHEKLRKWENSAHVFISVWLPERGVSRCYISHYVFSSIPPGSDRTKPGNKFAHLF